MACFVRKIQAFWCFGGVRCTVRFQCATSAPYKQAPSRCLISASSSESALGPRRGRLFQGAAVEFQRTTGAMTRGEISKVHNNGKYDIIYTVDGKWLVKVNVLGTGVLPPVPYLG